MKSDTGNEGLARIHASAFDDGWSAAYIAALRAGPGVVALADERERGMILIRVAADEAEILTLAVEPAARRRGLGRALVQAGAKHAQALGAEKMYLEVESGNIVAYTLYHSLGFAEVGKRLSYYHDTNGVNHDALVLCVKLPLEEARSEGQFS